MFYSFKILLLFQSLGIHVVLTILLITCTVSFTIRGVDSFRDHRDSFGGSTVPGKDEALIYVASVSYFEFFSFLSLWSGN